MQRLETMNPKSVNRMILVGLVLGLLGGTIGLIDGDPWGVVTVAFALIGVAILAVDSRRHDRAS